MTLKSQDTRIYRGLVWVGRMYRLAGWLGLFATGFVTLLGFFIQWNYMSVYYNLDFLSRFSQSLLAAGAFLVIGLLLSGVAFGISVAIQVGLTLMKDSQTRVDLLRRLAESQSEADSVLRLEAHGGDPSAVMQPDETLQQHRGQV